MTPSCFGPNAPRLNAPKHKFLLSVTSSKPANWSTPPSHLFLSSVNLDHINIITETIKVVRNAQEATWAPDETGSLSTMKEETAQNFDPDNVALIAQDVDRLNTKVQEQITHMADIGSGQRDVRLATSASTMRQELDSVLQHIEVLLLKMKEEHGGSQRTENAVLAAFENQRKAHEKKD
ncbi:hypothetical protein FB107DRAFT_288094 [Schizophyllum commune]